MFLMIFITASHILFLFFVDTANLQHVTALSKEKQKCAACQQKHQLLSARDAHQAY